MKAVKFLAGLVLAVSLLFGGMVAAESPALSIKTIELVGESGGKVQLEDVISAGRLKKGTNLLKLPTDAAERRIETLPWVFDAQVERILPSRIRVRIVQRKPAFVVISGSTPWILDGHGVVLEQGQPGLMHLLDLPLPALQPGQKLDLTQFEHASKVVTSLPSALRTRLARVRAASVDRITLELADGTAIVYGAAEQMEDKNYAATRLLELYDGKGTSVETIDVRVPTRPAVKPRTTSESPRPA